MATQNDVRKIALALPATREVEGRFAFEVLNGSKYKGYAWVWLQRVDPRKARVPCPEVLAIRVASLDAKEIFSWPIRANSSPNRTTTVIPRC